MTNKTEREAFEAWASGLKCSVERDQYGAYVASYTDDMWDGWQARAALSAAPTADDVASSFEFDHFGITHTVSGSAESIKALLAWKAHQEKVTNNALRMVAAK